MTRTRLALAPQGMICALGTVAGPVTTGGTGPGGTPWGDTVPTVQQIQQYCTEVSRVVVPSTNKRNKGGTSVEVYYICPDGSSWTIQTIFKPNGDIFDPTHIRPGKPKYGPLGG